MTLRNSLLSYIFGALLIYSLVCDTRKCIDLFNGLLPTDDIRFAVQERVPVRIQVSDVENLADLAVRTGDFTSLHS